MLLPKLQSRATPRTYSELLNKKWEYDRESPLGGCAGECGISYDTFHPIPATATNSSTIAFSQVVTYTVITYKNVEAVLSNFPSIDLHSR